MSDATPTEEFGPVAVVGLGYVGTSLSAVLAAAGYEVRGIDVDAERVATVNRGECPVEEERITELFEDHAGAGRITASESFDPIAECDPILVTVGTPLADADPDISAVQAATESIGEHVDPGDLVVYRSTLPATTTESELLPTLAAAAGVEASELDVAFCPERMAEGSAYEDLTSVPVVVGAVGERARDRTERFWASTGLETVAVSGPTAAEFTKLVDNWWIDLNIAMANEVALLGEQLGVDATEVIHAANTLPKGEHNVNVLFPGAGVGGSCLTKDPWFVVSLGEERGVEIETARVSREVNDAMPAHLVDLTAGALAGVDGGGLDGARVAVLGYAFKAGTDDTRHTPAKEVVETLRERGADIAVTDPYVSDAVVADEVGVDPVSLSEALDGADAVAVVTGHEQFRMGPERLCELVGRDSFVVADGRHVFAWDAFDGTDVIYRGVGRGRRD